MTCFVCGAETNRSYGYARGPAANICQPHLEALLAHPTFERVRDALDDAATPKAARWSRAVVALLDWRREALLAEPPACAACHGSGVEDNGHHPCSQCGGGGEGAGA